MLYVGMGWMDGWDWMVIIGLMFSRGTFDANNQVDNYEKIKPLCACEE